MHVTAGAGATYRTWQSVRTSRLERATVTKAAHSRARMRTAARRQARSSRPSGRRGEAEGLCFCAPPEAESCSPLPPYRPGGAGGRADGGAGPCPAPACMRALRAHSCERASARSPMVCPLQWALLHHHQVVLMLWLLSYEHVAVLIPCMLRPSSAPRVRGDGPPRALGGRGGPVWASACLTCGFPPGMTPRC